MTTMIFHLTAFFLANFGGFTEMVRYGWTDIRTYGRTYGRTHRHEEKEAYARNFVIVRCTVGQDVKIFAHSRFLLLSSTFFSFGTS